MTRWREVTLEEVCDSIDDGDWIETKDQGGSDYRLLQVSNIGVGHFRETGKYRYVTQETFDRLRCHEIRPGMVLVARMPDPVGRAWYVDRLLEPAITAVDVAIVDPDPTQLDGRFCAYLLNSPQQLAHAAAVAGGTTRLRITRKQLAAFQLRLPDLPYQRAVARVLAHFDDLIENNRRRIELLEEMARAIYREWFVHFRYPGHEDVPLVNSPLGPIPDGWAVRSIGELARVDKGLSYKGAHLAEIGTPMANLKCLRPGGGFRRDGVKPYDGPFKPKHRVSAGDLVMANTDLTQAGTVIGSPAFVPRSGFEEGGIASHHLFIVRPAEDVYRAWLFETFRDTRFRGFARSVASGTTVLGFRPADLNAYHVAVPPLDLLERFEATAGDLAALGEDLAETMEVLATQRDLLLPKLVTGQIDVTRLDLDELVEVASA